MPLETPRGYGTPRPGSSQFALTTPFCGASWSASRYTRSKGGFEIELSGEIARMVELSHGPNGTKKAALDERTACSGKVVAGARNCLNLLLFTSSVIAGAAAS